MNPLDKFGEFIVTKLRDRAIEQHLLMQEGHWKSPAIQDLQREIVALSPEQKELLRHVVVDVVDTALHDLLFAIQEAHDTGAGIEVTADGENVAELSGMLQGEHLGEDGWITRFSRYPHLRKA